MLYKVVLTFDSVDEILQCDHSNESYCVALSRGSDCFSTGSMGSAGVGPTHSNTPNLGTSLHLRRVDY